MGKWKIGRFFWLWISITSIGAALSLTALLGLNLASISTALPGTTGVPGAGIIIVSWMFGILLIGAVFWFASGRFNNPPNNRWEI